MKPLTDDARKAADRLHHLGMRYVGALHAARQFAEEYAWLTKQKAEFLGVEVTDQGIIFRAKETPP